MEYLFIILILFLVLATTRALTVVIHELGHAVPAIFLTKEKVAIYIGSFGDPNKSLHVNIGLLEVWFKYSPFLWGRGLCVMPVRWLNNAGLCRVVPF
ncbi:hypothetical protein SAMN05216436_12835 [bacterium A37T11]|nr:hypothetical protein SAMN05216436_12835 [bacterium A37T11]